MAGQLRKKADGPELSLMDSLMDASGFITFSSGKLIQEKHFFFFFLSSMATLK